MPAKAFFDSNVLLYLADDARRPVVKDLLESGGVISVQVLNEFVNVARRKHQLDWPTIHRSLQRFRMICEVVPLTLATHDRALAIAERYGFSIHDSMIVAAALNADCDILWTEDLQHGQRIEAAITLRNPFA